MPRPREVLPGPETCEPVENDEAAGDRRGQFARLHSTAAQPRVGDQRQPADRGVEILERRSEGCIRETQRVCHAPDGNAARRHHVAAAVAGDAFDQERRFRDECRQVRQAADANGARDEARARRRVR